jgi:hypothetical protein
MFCNSFSVCKYGWLQAHGKTAPKVPQAVQAYKQLADRSIICKAAYVNTGSWKQLVLKAEFLGT